MIPRAIQKLNQKMFSNLLKYLQEVDAVQENEADPRVKEARQKKIDIKVAVTCKLISKLQDKYEIDYYGQKFPKCGIDEY